MSGGLLWLLVLAVASLATADFALKQSSGRISSSLGTLIYAAAALVVPIAWTAVEAARGSLTVTRDGVLWAIVTGFAFSGVAGLMFVLFRAGADLSIVVPVMRTGGIVIIAVVGIALFGERFSWLYSIGLATAVIGIGLMIAARSA